MARLRRVLWWLHRPGSSWRVVGTVDAADEVPAQLPRRAAILAGSSRDPQWLVFDCPCAEKHRVMLNLNRRRYPQWTLEQRDPLTIRPSVDDHHGHRHCHYVIRNGKIRWIPLELEES
jgi:hypothetical protein